MNKSLLKKSLVTLVLVLFLTVSIIPVVVSDTLTSDRGSLSGYVTDPHSNPVEGAVVRALCGDNYFENTSDSSGYYYIDNIPIIFCIWNVSASKKGYKTSWVEMSIGENTTCDFVLTSSDRTLYVGGDGPGNYSKIQDAITYALPGDTVFVYSGTYHECIIIDKTINLIGEDKNNTIIDGLKRDSVIVIIAESVSIKNFTIRDGINGFDDKSDKTSISHNIIIDNDKGIKTSYSENVNITGNIIAENNVLSDNFIVNGTAREEFSVVNLGVGTVNLFLNNNSSSNVVPVGFFNFDLQNNGGGAFNVTPVDVNGANVGTVGSSNGSVTIP